MFSQFLGDTWKRHEMVCEDIQLFIVGLFFWALLSLSNLFKKIWKMKTLKLHDHMLVYSFVWKNSIEFPFGIKHDFITKGRGHTGRIRDTNMTFLFRYLGDLSERCFTYRNRISFAINVSNIHWPIRADKWFKSGFPIRNLSLVLWFSPKNFTSQYLKFRHRLA